MPHVTELCFDPIGSADVAGCANDSQIADQSLFIVPTDRHRDELIHRSRLPEQQVATFPRLLAILTPTVPADRLPEAHQRMLLDHVVNELARQKKLKAFSKLVGQPGFMRALFAELSELSSTGISPADFAQALQELSARPRPKDVDIASIYAAFRALLAQQQWHDRASDYESALHQFDRAFQTRFPKCHIVQVSGFTQFSATQLALFQRLKQLNVAIRLSLPADDATDESREELFRVCRNSATQLQDLCPDQHVCQSNDNTPLSAGLMQIADNLFRPNAARSADADGLYIIEAPGLVGEVKMVVRAVKSLLLDGAKPDDVLISMRELQPYADLLEEFCAEYGIPIEMEGITPLTRVPVVAALLKAAKLPDDDWPFVATGALLRNSFLQPNWPEVIAEPEIALDTELLLRLLGEPRGRDAYLHAATIQAKNLDPPLEDESAGSSDRRFRQKLADRCLPFLTRFLSAWGALPKNAPLHDFVQWLQSFADDLGFTRTATDRDAEGLEEFFAELTSWASRTQQLHKKPVSISRADFWHVAESIAAANGLPRTTAGPGRVRIVPAELAAGLSYQHLFLTGLSEGSFPNLSIGPRLYDEKERRDFRGVGIDLDVAEERRPAEMLLFFRMVAGADKSVTLSYPAVDVQGQSLLPATFLDDVKELFVEDAIPVTRRQMLIEGLDSDEPMSATEYRWRFATAGGNVGPLSPELVENLSAAALMAKQRFASSAFGSYDGLLTNSKVVQDVDRQFGPSTPFSATSLEHYVACPFKYFVGTALQLRALPEPGEEIEARMRGAAYHRAVARFHGKQPLPGPGIESELADELGHAVEEYSRRASSPITQALWELESDRLKRHAQHYGAHWQKFRDKCNQPRPEAMEIDFGPGKDNDSLIVRADNLEIRIIGRIDRIDVVDHEDGSGFWIIDYKTGKSGNYPKTAIDRFEALQLPLYAMATEKFAHFSSMRPMGIAYWFPTSGHKVAKQWRGADEWKELRDRLKQVLTELVRHIRAGEFPLQPGDPDNCTLTCDFSQMCRIAQSRGINKNWTLSLPLVESANNE